MKTANTLLTGTALLLGGMMLCGCQNTVNTISEAETHAAVHVVKDKRFVTDSALKNRLKLKEVNTSETAEGFLRVQVSALNDGAPYRISYKFVWLDEKGMAVSDGVWMTRLIQPGETVYFQSVAPTARCRDFILNVKEAEDTF